MPETVAIIVSTGRNRRLLLREIPGMNWIGKGDVATAQRWFDQSLELACRQVADADPAGSARMNDLAEMFALEPGLATPP